MFGALLPIGTVKYARNAYLFIIRSTHFDILNENDSGLVNDLFFSFSFLIARIVSIVFGGLNLLDSRLITLSLCFYAVLLMRLVRYDYLVACCVSVCVCGCLALLDGV